MFRESICHCFSGLRRSSPSAPAPLITAACSSSPCPSPVVFMPFNSLFDPIDDSETLTLSLSSSFSSSGGTPNDDDRGCGGGSCPSKSVLSTAIASRRLLPASPGRSNSIVESAAIAVGIGDGAGVAVSTYSADPHLDFRRSMEEMVAALGLDTGDNRGKLHELLLCYLALNGKHAHKYILSAFADLLLALPPTAVFEDGSRSA